MTFLTIPFHPFTVHFPIAFLVGAGFLYLIDVFYQKYPFRRWAFAMHGGGTLAMVFTILSGREARSDISVPPAVMSMLFNHELIGYSAIWVFAMMLIWHYLRPVKIPKWESYLFCLIFLFAVALMLYGSHLGGRMVYEEGIGISPGSR